MELVHTVGLNMPEPPKDQKNIKSLRNSRTVRSRP